MNTAQENLLQLVRKTIENKPLILGGPDESQGANPGDTFTGSFGAGIHGEPDLITRGVDLDLATDVILSARKGKWWEKKAMIVDPQFPDLVFTMEKVADPNSLGQEDYTTVLDALYKKDFNVSNYEVVEICVSAQ